MFHLNKTPGLLCLLIAATGVSLVLCHTQSQQVNYQKDVNNCWSGGIKKPCHTDFIGSRKGIQVNSVESPTTAAVDVSGNTQLNIHVCPPWSFFNGTACECGNDVNGVVYCNPDMNSTFVLNCYCMTYDNVTDTIVLGVCIYNCFNSSKTAILPRSMYHLLPQNVDDLNDVMCNHFNRRGQLCSRCKQGFFIPAYSYSLHCIRCTYRSYNWIKYIVTALGPLTLFFFIVITFQISVTLPPLLVFVQVCHTLSLPQLVRSLLARIESINSLELTIARILVSLYGIWNLDFFRTLLPPICLQLTSLETIALDYIIAFYPLVLVVFTYILVELHDRNFRPVVLLWKPFHRCFVCIRRQWNIKTSIIDAFATFLVLSYMKFVSISIDLLIPTQLFDVHGKPLHTIYLYNDATIEYFGKEHTPYAIVALTVLLFVVILPLVLLVLYPCQCFQRCLTRCRLRTHALHTFMDAFQGCYKDGTNGTRDCRWFAAVYLGARLITYTTLLAMSLNTFSLTLFASIYMMVIVMLIAVQPYSTSNYNILDPIVVIFQVLFRVFVLTASNAYASLPKDFLKISFVVAFVLYCVPLLYMSGAFLYWIVAKRRVTQWCRPNRCLHTELEASLADRLVHPEQYEIAS